MVKRVAYVPARGDVVWVDFDPQSGREIMKRRPALVLSADAYNRISGLCIMCPITSAMKGHRLEVPIRVEGKEGVVKSDQVKSFDWQARRVSFIEKAAPHIVDDVAANLSALLCL